MDREVRNMLDMVHGVMVAHYGSEFLVSGRRRECVERRQLFARVAVSVFPNLKYVELAEYMGLNHATVTYGVSHAQDLMEFDAAYRASFCMFRRKAIDRLDVDGLGLLAQDGYEI